MHHLNLKWFNRRTIYLFAPVRQIRRGAPNHAAGAFTLSFAAEDAILSFAVIESAH